jgi:flagellar hook-basal body complex protein FliE
MDLPGITMRVPSLGAPGLGAEKAAPLGGGTALNGFGKALTDAISGLSQSQNIADSKSVQLAAGDPVDLHEVMLARETAGLDFQLALQVRNKLVEAYQDVMRMQL